MLELRAGPVPIGEVGPWQILGFGGLAVLFDDGEYRRLATPQMIYVKASKADAKGLDDITDTPEGRCALDSINERIAVGDGSLTIR